MFSFLFCLLPVILFSSCVSIPCHIRHSLLFRCRTRNVCSSVCFLQPLMFRLFLQFHHILSSIIRRGMVSLLRRSLLPSNITSFLFVFEYASLFLFECMSRRVTSNSCGSNNVSHPHSKCTGWCLPSEGRNEKEISEK